ncbi:MAG: hypothetical protein E7Z64_04085 [Thermoplasmata archaeon]|nr:hypothetical protein [Thermoplasmata archaeon]
MVGRLGTHADILMTESVLGHILGMIDQMLIESPQAGLFFLGEVRSDDSGKFSVITGVSDSGGIGLCIGSSEGGTEPTEEDIGIFKSKVGSGILMKADVFAHQFSFYKVDESVEDATVLFTE